MATVADHHAVPETIGWDGTRRHVRCVACKRMLDPDTLEHVED